MHKIKSFIKTSLIGGAIVILPIAILVFLFKWIFDLITGAIQPLTTLLVQRYGMVEIIADVVVVLFILTICFVVGSMVSTRLGQWLHNQFDTYLVRLAPGYKMIKEVLGQFFGDRKNSPFKSGAVARVKLFGSDIETSVTALVTSRHEDGTITVFMPTGPNPTSGIIYHMPSEQVEMIEGASVEEAMRSIIACGAGSDKLFKRSRQASQGGEGEAAGSGANDRKPGSEPAS